MLQYPSVIFNSRRFPCQVNRYHHFQFYCQVDTLKIDRSFVMDLESNRENAAICAAIIAMAHALDLLVIAEGVETEAQKSYLREQKCDQIQGYLISKPLPAEALENAFLMDARSTTPVPNT